MRNLLTQMYLSYKGLFMWLNVTGYVSNAALRPVLMVVMVVLVGRFGRNFEALGEYIIGLAAYSCAYLILGGVMQSMYYDRGLGTMPLSFATAANRTMLYFSRGVLHMPNGIVTAIMSILAGWLLFDLNVGGTNWLLLAATILVIGVTATTFSLFIGTLSVVFNEWVSLYGFVVGVLFLLTGAIIPVSRLPGLLTEFSFLLPLTNGLFALRGAIEGTSIADMWPHLLAETGVGALYAIIGLVTFRLFEVYARRSGILEATV